MQCTQHATKQLCRGAPAAGQHAARPTLKLTAMMTRCVLCDLESTLACAFGVIRFLLSSSSSGICVPDMTHLELHSDKPSFCKSVAVDVCQCGFVGCGLRGPQRSGGLSRWLLFCGGL